MWTSQFVSTLKEAEKILANEWVDSVSGREADFRAQNHETSVQNKGYLVSFNNSFDLLNILKPFFLF